MSVIMYHYSAPYNDIPYKIEKKWTSPTCINMNEFFNIAEKEPRYKIAYVKFQCDKNYTFLKDTCITEDPTRETDPV